MVFFEYVPYGDLLGYLRRSRGLSDTYYSDPDIKPASSLKSKQLLKFAREIADGMAFISSKKVNILYKNWEYKPKTLLYPLFLILDDVI